MVVLLPRLAQRQVGRDLHRSPFGAVLRSVPRFWHHRLDVLVMWEAWQQGSREISKEVME